MKRLLIFTVGLLLSVSCYAGEVSHWYMNDDAANSTVTDSYGSNDGTYIDIINGLVSQWRMNSDWNDSYGSNDGTAYGATFDTNNQKVGSACGEFDGSDDYVDMGSIGLLEGVSDFTISAWVYIPSATSGHHRIISQERIYYVGRYGGQYSFYLDDNGIGWSHNSTSMGTVTTGEWVHLTYVKDGTDAYVYENTNQVGSMSAPSTLGSNDDRWTAIGTFDGNDSSGVQSGGQMWNGLIDDLRIYNRALTSTEISNIYNSGSGTEVQDALSTSMGSVTGKINNALEITAKDQVIEISDINNTTITASMWYKYDGVGGNWNTLLCRDGGTYHHLLIESDGSGEIGFYNSDWNGSGYNLSIGNWYHLVMIKDGTNHKLYINTNLEQDSNNSFDNNDYPLSRIGNYGGNTQGALGIVDDVRIYDHALTQEEIDKLYNNGEGTEKELADISFGQVIMINIS